MTILEAVSGLLHSVCCLKNYADLQAVETMKVVKDGFYLIRSTCPDCIKGFLSLFLAIK
jgi:hypothetical protein